jgi:hypothetical protein
LSLALMLEQEGTSSASGEHHEVREREDIEGGFANSQPAPSQHI